jgi:hypothetical protein
MKEILRRQNSVAISRQVSLASLLYVFPDNFKRSLVDESGMIRTDGEAQNIRSGRSARFVLCAHPVTVPVTVGQETLNICGAFQTP